MKDLDINFPLKKFEKLINDIGWESLDDWFNFWNNKRNTHNTKHPIFAKNRAGEFEDRCLGKTYEEIAEGGGGILSSIKDLRNINEDYLFDYCLKNINYFLANGTTTIEAKSGYGLTLEDEIKSL